MLHIMYYNVTLYVMKWTSHRELLFRLLEQMVQLGRSHTYELSKLLSISPPHANRMCNGLLRKKNLTFEVIGNRKLFSLNYENPLTRELLRLLTLLKIQDSKLFNELGRICPFGVYGSFSEGRQRGDSDIDLWVYSSRKEEKKIRGILNQIEKEWGHAINVIYLDDGKLNKMKQIDSEFYIRLRGQSLTIKGRIFG